MLRSCDYVSWEFSCGYFDDIGSSALLCYHAYTSMISPVGHSLLHGRIDRDRNHLTRNVWDEKSSQRILSLVSGLSAKKGPVPVPNTFGPLHPTIAWLEMESG